MDYKKRAEEIRDLKATYIKRFGKDKDFNRVERLLEKCALLCEKADENIETNPITATVAVMEMEGPWNQLVSILRNKER